MILASSVTPCNQTVALVQRRWDTLPSENSIQRNENLRFDQFCDTIKALFGSDIRNQDLKVIYRKISTNPDAKVDWSEIFGYFQSSVDERDEIAVGEEVSVFTVSKRKRVGEAPGDKKRRDIVQSIKYIPAFDGYLSISLKGAIVIWDSKLHLQSCVDINEAAWATGCDYLPNIRKIACCTERSITIWDNRSKNKNQQIFSIKPLSNSPQCLIQIPTPGNVLEDTILFGDDQGYINRLRIVGKDITMKNSNNAEKKQEWENFVIDPSKLTYKVERRKMHDDWVLRVKYFPELRCFGSCSPSSTKSFVLEELERINDNQEIRGLSVPKGLNAFDYCAKANIIATGGVDKIVRVWHPHIFSRPTGKLMGHLFTIVDICCNEKDQHIISLSTARVFRVWDIHTLTCLQVFTDNEERPGEKRISSMVFDPRHDRLLTGSSVIDAWPLTRAVQDTMQVPHTHDRSISLVLYNKELNQLISVCTGSFIKVWETETGKIVYSIAEVHGANIEVTAMTLDSSGYRLVTGALDGSIKVWDAGSGQVLKQRSGRASDEDLSITGLVYCKLEGDRVILATGWNNKIRIILDTNENYDLPVVREFSDIYYWTQEVSLALNPDPFKIRPLPAIGGVAREPSIQSRQSSNASLANVFKKEYILSTHDVTCFDTILPNTLLTGCTNGNIIKWDIENSRVESIFQLPDTDHLETSSNSSHASHHRRRHPKDRRIHMMRVLVHKTYKPDPAFRKTVAIRIHKECDETGGDDNRAASRQPSRASNHSAKPEEPNPTEENSKDPLEDTDDQTDKEKDENKTGDETARENGTASRETDYDEPQFENSRTKYLETAYEPVIVTVHQDSYIRFWNMEGCVLREVSALNKRQGTDVTAVCCDRDCNVIITGDMKGYLTIWDIGSFLENPESEDQDLLKQGISWRAHLTKVVTLVYVDYLKCVLSGSTDGSVRVWWGRKGRYVGFLSQHKPLVFPKSEETAGPAILPYDISEKPLAPVKNKSGKQKIRPIQLYEYPLIFDNEKWQPFRRSAYVNERSKKEMADKKFFGALIKPGKGSNRHIDSFTYGEIKQGAVFRALPVYDVETLEKPKTPDIAFNIDEAGGPGFLFAGNSHPQPGASSHIIPRHGATHLTRRGSQRSLNSRRGSEHVVPSHHHHSLTPSLTSAPSSHLSTPLPHMTSYYLKLQHIQAATSSIPVRDPAIKMVSWHMPSPTKSRKSVPRGSVMETPSSLTPSGFTSATVSPSPRRRY
ncbi:hypothetical protein ScPMuIL_013894 [Solemya velum]